MPKGVNVGGPASAVRIELGRRSGPGVPDVDAADGSELARYESADATVETAFVLGELYRRQEAWKFRAVGQDSRRPLPPSPWRSRAVRHELDAGPQVACRGEPFTPARARRTCAPSRPRPAPCSAARRNPPSSGGTAAR
ncbi:TerD family protein [Streptomyces sp. NPDC059897]|uniref:TerD family protein n=1 Tax=Streptomyces sp. NPDC059897 TaxID=3346994 RepID=UPI00364F3322